MTMEPDLITAVLLDDEADSIGVMKILLKKYAPEVHILASLTNSSEALDFLRTNQPDILFLDIEMPGMDGFELLSELGRFSFTPIFISAYEEFGIKALRYKVFDYLIKPIDPQELVTTIQRYKEELIRNQEPRIKKEEQISFLFDKVLLPVGNEYEFVKVNDILRCEADDNYTTLYLSNQTFLVSRTLKFFEENLPLQYFLRVHNKHLININQIKKYIKSDGGYFELIDGSLIPLSRYRKEEILKRIGLG